MLFVLQLLLGLATAAVQASSASTAARDRQRHASAVLVGGWFTSPGRRAAVWEQGATWVPAGDGVNGDVNAVCSWSPAGRGAAATAGAATTQMVVAGVFSEAGAGVAASCVAAWSAADGAWTPLGAGVSNTVDACVSFDGTLVLGGDFTSAGGAPASRVARWDGAAWTPLGAGLPSTVQALAVFRDTLIAGGVFSGLGYLAAWNGAAWESVGGGVNNAVYVLTVHDGALYVGGSFTLVGGTVRANYVARWDGAAWSSLGTGVDNVVRALATYRGVLAVGGLFATAGGVPASRIALWDGNTWTALGAGTSNQVYALVAIDGGTTLVAGGFFDTAGGVDANHIAQWNGTTWAALGDGVNDRVYALLVLNDAADDGCSLSAYDWRAQYYVGGVDGDVLVADALVFDDAALAFAQNMSAYTPCADDWVAWTGTYELANATALELSYIRCSQSGVGCIACTPTREETVQVTFAADCATLYLQHSDGSLRTYFPAAAVSQ